MAMLDKQMVFVTHFRDFPWHLPAPTTTCLLEISPWRDHRKSHAALWPVPQWSDSPHPVTWEKTRHFHSWWLWRGMEWYGMVWNGMEWYGTVWNGMERYGMVWNGMEWYGIVWKWITPTCGISMYFIGNLIHTPSHTEKKQLRKASSRSKIVCKTFFLISGETVQSTERTSYRPIWCQYGARLYVKVKDEWPSREGGKETDQKNFFH